MIASISGLIGDKNWKDELIRKRAVVDLVAGSLIQGCIGKIFNGQLSVKKSLLL